MFANKEQKYDRQLRLWGDHGQAALESAHVALLGANITGAEILKGLVLPGIGKFTIVDGATVNTDDVHGNFFLDYHMIGQNRAEVAVTNMKELNPDVMAEAVPLFVDDFLLKHSDRLADFTLVIACEISEKNLIRLSNLLWKQGVPLVISRAYGLAGSIRLVYNEHIVEDAHDENPVPDFRLSHPFPELLQHLKSIDLETLNHQQHSHVPYLVLLFKALEKWEATRGSKMPASYAERKEFKMILTAMQMPDSKGIRDEENFDEAIRAVNTTLHPTSVSPQVQALFSSQKCTELSVDSSQFWIICAAIGDFVKRHGYLPLRGTLPDMISSSDSYVGLLEVYRSRAASEAREVNARVVEICASVGYRVEISESDVHYFCRNAAFLRVIQGSSLGQEFGENGRKKYEDNLDGYGCNEMALYLLIRAADRFFVEMNRFPGCNGVPIDLDKNDLRERFERLATVPKSGSEKSEESELKFEAYLEEVCRYAAVELHSTAGLIGGIASQECIKLITKQFVPLDNTLVYNGVTGEATTFKL